MWPICYKLCRHWILTTGLRFKYPSPFSSFKIANRFLSTSLWIMLLELLETANWNDIFWSMVLAKIKREIKAKSTFSWTLQWWKFFLSSFSVCFLVESHFVDWCGFFVCLLVSFCWKVDRDREIPSTGSFVQMFTMTGTGLEKTGARNAGWLLPRGEWLYRMGITSDAFRHSHQQEGAREPGRGTQVLWCGHRHCSLLLEGIFY